MCHRPPGSRVQKRGQAIVSISTPHTHSFSFSFWRTASNSSVCVVLRGEQYGGFVLSVVVRLCALPPPPPPPPPPPRLRLCHFNLLHYESDKHQQQSTHTEAVRHRHRHRRYVKPTGKGFGISFTATTKAEGSWRPHPPPLGAEPPGTAAGGQSGH